MTGHYSQLVAYKRWADRGLYEVIGRSFERLDAQDAAILMRVLDHIHVVDRIFQHHLRGAPHAHQAPRSEQIPELEALAENVRKLDDWYVAYAADLTARDFEEPVDFVFTSGKPGRMRRGEIILHVCLHGAYHRGNVGVLLHKNGVAPNDDRLTDFLEVAAVSWSDTCSME